MAYNPPKLSDMRENIVELDDENKDRNLINFSDEVDNLGDRSRTNTSLLEQKEKQEDQNFELIESILQNPLAKPELNISLVASLMAQMTPEKEICGIFGVTRQELVQYVESFGNVTYLEFIQRVQVIPKHKLRRMQFQSAEQGSVQMQIWLGKQILGQQDSPKAETPPVIIYKTDDDSTLPQQPPIQEDE